MDNKINSVSQKIFDMLEERGMTQKELSDLTGIPTSTICDWRKKGSVPSSDKVQKICSALNISSEVLLGQSSQSVDAYVIDVGNELYEVVELFNSLEDNKRERILQYMKAMIDIEKDK